MQGNENVRSIFRSWLMPFKDVGANTLTLANTGGTDHLSFDAIGLPGFQFIQDEIEYNARTHHSNMDIRTRARAVAFRAVTSFSPTLTICAWPSRVRCVSEMLAAGLLLLIVR